VSPKSDDNLINKGIIIHRPTESSIARGRTFIVTGLYRSGTSLVASILRQAGIFMGQQINDVVFEDNEILAVLRTGDAEKLKRMIAERNANYGTWGFKMPLVYAHLHPAQVALFENAHLIVPFRDIAAIVVRNSLSEYKEALTGSGEAVRQRPNPGAMAALRGAVSQLNALLTFLDTVSAPSLLLSYEKALIFPGEFIDALVRFCGLPANANLRARLIGLVEPNRQHYLTRARRIYRGRIDAVVDGRMFGWCHQIGSTDPVPLELFVDDQLAKSFLADVFRQDLLEAGIGTGAHGFIVQLGGPQPKQHSIVSVRVAGGPIELDNSGHGLAHYRVDPA
jgi:hypothetical protein